MTDRDEPVGHRLAAWVEAFVRRALAEPVRAYALIAEPVDPAIEAERLTFRRAYADLFERALHDGVHRGELPSLDAQLTAAAIVGALAEALVGPLERRQAGADVLVAGLQTFVLRSVGIAHEHADA
jgi:AcrR family transcriptional regulator